MLGGQESRGVLKKINDMLEMIMKRMDALSKLGNSTNTHRLDELSSALGRYRTTPAALFVKKNVFSVWIKRVKMLAKTTFFYDFQGCKAQFQKVGKSKNLYKPRENFSQYINSSQIPDSFSWLQVPQ